MHNKHITFITGSMGRGGAERVISILAKHFASSGWNVDIVMVLHSFIDYELDERIKIVDLSTSCGIRKGFFRTLSNIRNYVKNQKPDIVVCFMAQICLLTYLALINIDIPIIMSERIDPSMVQRNFLYEKALETAYSSATKVVFQTKRAKQYFSKKIQNNGCIIGNPINVNVHQVNNPGHIITTAGRMTEQKNQALLISAFSKIHKNHPEYKLVVYGDGPLKEKLYEQIELLEMDNYVAFPGNVLDLHARLSEAEIFVLPSNYEGLSNALLEAMMMGMPVISTNCAGSDEVIVNSENGILINVGDEDALVQALELLITNEDLRKKIANNGEKSVERFNVENIIGEWEQLIINSIRGCK